MLYLQAENRKRDELIVCGPRFRRRGGLGRRAAVHPAHVHGSALRRPAGLVSLLWLRTTSCYPLRLSIQVPALLGPSLSVTAAGSVDAGSPAGSEVPRTARGLREHARSLSGAPQRAAPLNLLALDGASGGGRARGVHDPGCKANSRVTPPAGWQRVIGHQSPPPSPQRKRAAESRPISR